MVLSFQSPINIFKIYFRNYRVINYLVFRKMDAHLLLKNIKILENLNHIFLLDIIQHKKDINIFIQ